MRKEVASQQEMVITRGEREAGGTGYSNEILEGLNIMRERDWKKTQVLHKYWNGRRCLLKGD